MPADDMPAAEVDIDPDLVERLIASQFPALSSLGVRPLASGWDNALFRLGDDLVVRLPRRRMGVPLVEHEQRWLPDLAPRLPLPIPAPLHAGVPEHGYPWPWSICPFFPGTSVLALVDGDGVLAEPIAEARRLGEFLAALHQPAPADAPHNPLRGVPLIDRDDRFVANLALVVDTVDEHAVRSTWAAALEVPSRKGPAVWVHGDVHPGNLITDGDRITAVIDLGDLCAGDPASDLVIAWMLFSGDTREAFRRSVAVDDDTWHRGRGWSLALAVALLATSADNAPYQRLGARTLAAVLDDA